MSTINNLQPDSVITCIDHPEYLQPVLDASLWAAKVLRAPLGLLHSTDCSTRKGPVDYSGCLVGDDGDSLLTKFTLERKNDKSQLRDQGRALLKKSSDYCKQQHMRYEYKISSIHRHAPIAETLDDIDDLAQLVVLGRKVTCKDSLEKLIRTSKCPTLVVHQEFSAPKTALFAFDGSITCHGLLKWLCRNPLVRNMNVHVVMVGERNEKNKDIVRETYARLKQSGIKCTKALIESEDITNALINYQKDNQIDMLITGAFGDSRLHKFLHGSDTEKLLRANNTPYLLYPKSVIR